MIGAVLALALAVPAHADDVEAETCVRTKVRDSYGEGWSVRSGAKATLKAGEHHVYAVSLQAGNTYRVTGCGDTAVRDLDVVIYDADAKALVDDTTDDREPIVEWTASTTGTYFVVVYVGATTEPDAAAGVASMVTYR